VENDLILLDCPLIEHLAGMYFRARSMPLALASSWMLEIAHFKLEGEDVHARDVFLPALKDHFFDEESCDRRLMGPTDTRRPAFLP